MEHCQKYVYTVISNVLGSSEEQENIDELLLYTFNDIWNHNQDLATQ